jgi:hypothetical protein
MTALNPAPAFTKPSENRPTAGGNLAAQRGQRKIAFPRHNRERVDNQIVGAASAVSRSLIRAVNAHGALSRFLILRDLTPDFSGRIESHGAE